MQSNALLGPPDDLGGPVWDVMLYEEVEAEPTATSQAATVVGIVAVCGGIGNGLGQVIQGSGPGCRSLHLSDHHRIRCLDRLVDITFWVGTSIFKGTQRPARCSARSALPSRPGC